MVASVPMTRSACAALLVATALGLSGCGDFGSVSSTETDFGKLGAILFHQITGIGSSEGVPRARAAAIPYATIGVRLGGSDETMLVLASKSGDSLLWLAGTTFAVTTRHGRVVRTVGFSHNISGVQTASGAAGDFSQPSVDYLYDFADESRFGIPVRCARQNLGPERIVIIGVSHDTSHVEEDCNAASMDWSFRNDFWIDSAGHVWRSRQFVHPKLDALTLEVLRPAAE